ncbi:MAG: alpha/beta fold hydrolase [Alphaproteobacteria bacterium]|nr:alpha/beta fold hydrolase [Alphaproteobacteria bacterium]
MDVGAVELPDFVPRAPWWGPDLQTVRNILLRDYPDLSPWPSRRIEIVADNGDVLLGSYHEGRDPGAPLVVMLHGLGGCEESAYVLAGARAFLESGYRVFRFNLRGAGPSSGTCRQLYHGGRSEDVGLMLSGLDREGIAGPDVYAVGYSLGGNTLLKYLGEAGDNARLGRVVSVSAPLDLATSADWLEKTRNRAYQAWLLGRIKEDWRGGTRDVTGEQRQVVERARSIRELDNDLVAPVNGFADADDYYARCSSGPYLENIRVPTLLLHGADDPWIPATTYLALEASLPEHVRMEVAPGGGHVGFHGRGGRWHDRCALAFFDAG